MAREVRHVELRVSDVCAALRQRDVELVVNAVRDLAAHRGVHFGQIYDQVTREHVILLSGEASIVTSMLKGHEHLALPRGGCDTPGRAP